MEIENRDLQEGTDSTKAKYVVPVKRDMKLLKEFVKFSNHVRHPRTTVYMFTVGASMLILPSVNHEIALPGVIICYIMGSLMVLISLFRHYIGTYMLKANPATKMDEELIYLFTNTGVQINKQDGFENMGSYKKIYRLWESEKIFYIGMNEDDLIVLPKKNFESGDVSTFRDFVLEKSRAIYTWQPNRIDNVIKQNVMQFQMRMRKQEQENEKEKK